MHANSVARSEPPFRAPPTTAATETDHALATSMVRSCKLTMVEAGSFALDLEPDEWIVQPPGYMMVGLKAASDRERRSMTGRITNPSCGGMKRARID